MKKDALLAILIGFAIGLTITALIVITPLLAKGFPALKLPKLTLPKFSSKVSPTPTPDVQAVITFSVDSPLADAIEVSDQLLVSGKAEPNSSIVLQTASDDVVTTANESGMWAAKVVLSEGKNDIVVTRYIPTQDATGTETQTIPVYYTPEE